jgi:hypothetical protein
MDPKESFDLAVQMFETVVAPKLRQWGISVTLTGDYSWRKKWTIESHNGSSTILITSHISGIEIDRGGLGGRILHTWTYPKEKAVKAIHRKLIKATAGAIVSICRTTAPPEFTRLYIDYRFAEEKIDWWVRNGIRTALPSHIALTLVIEPKRLRWKWIVEIGRRNKFTVRGDDNPIEAHHRILTTGISLATL